MGEPLSFEVMLAKQYPHHLALKNLVAGLKNSMERANVSVDLSADAAQVDLSRDNVNIRVKVKEDELSQKPAKKGSLPEEPDDLPYLILPTVPDPLYPSKRIPDKVTPYGPMNIAQVKAELMKLFPDAMSSGATTFTVEAKKYQNPISALKEAVQHLHDPDTAKAESARQTILDIETQHLVAEKAIDATQRAIVESGVLEKRFHVLGSWENLQEKCTVDNEIMIIHNVAYQQGRMRSWVKVKEIRREPDGSLSAKMEFLEPVESY